MLGCSALSSVCSVSGVQGVVSGAARAPATALAHCGPCQAPGTWGVAGRGSLVGNRHSGVGEGLVQLHFKGLKEIGDRRKGHIGPGL